MKLPSKVFIAGAEWTVRQSSKKGGGWFRTADRTIFVGTEAPKHVLHIFLHEVLEAIFVMRNLRFEGYSEDYLFSFDHKGLVNVTHDLEMALKDVIKRR